MYISMRPRTFHDLNRYGRKILIWFRTKGIQNTHPTFKRFNARKAGAYALMFFLFLFDAGSLKAQTPDPTPLNAPQPGVRPPLTPFPRYEDWSFLRDPALRVDPYDRLKFIPL